MMSKEYAAALKELEIARNHFANADPAFVETSIYEMMAAESKIAAFIIDSFLKTNHLHI